MSESDVAISMRGIVKRFGHQYANDHVDFEARFGEVHAIVGENGAGKSTLMSILAGFYRQDSGTVEIAGNETHLSSPGDAIAHGIGMVYQHFMLVDSFTVTENIMLGERSGSLLKLQPVADRVRALAEAYGLEVDTEARIWQLSVGEQQRVEILRLLYRGARILVLDEPTAVLTPQESAKLLATLRDLAATGFCIVFISHKLDEVLAVADRVTVLRRGQQVGTFDTSDANRTMLARMMVGREITDSAVRGKATRDDVSTGELVLELRDLVVPGERRALALDGLSLGIRAGDILGIAGVAGNGQRELAEAITGLRAVVSGDVFLNGNQITNADPGVIADAGVAHVPEDRLYDGMVGSLSVSSNAILRQFEQPHLTRGPMILRRAVDAFAGQMVRDYDVQPAKLGSAVQTLSGGNQQKLLIGRELTGNPVVLVLVHPTRGVDVGATAVIHDIIRMQRWQGAAILLISEDLDELFALSDRIATIHRGKILGEVPAELVFRDQIGYWMAGISDD